MRIAAPLNSEPSPVLQWVEVSSTRQLPSFHIIGLPSPEVAEARERVRAAIEASGFEFPKSRIVLNLSPASVRKRGTGLDLAIALAILVSASEIDSDPVVAWGELGLDGSVKSVAQLTRAIYSTWKAGIRRLIVSHEEHSEALHRCRWIEASGELPGPGPALIPASNLAEAWQKLSSPPEVASPADPGLAVQSALPVHSPETPSLIPLPRSVERTVSVAAAGQHHLLLVGPKGSGKSQALEWRGALEPLPAAGQQIRHRLLLELGGSSGDPAETSTSIRRVSAHVKPAGLIGQAVNHVFRPGEFTLADGGLLLADELPEWARDSREALREPLERGKIGVNRVSFAFELPASFTLAATGNLCPCGGWPREKPIPGQFLRHPKDKNRIDRCICRPSALTAYFSRLSGPILDRIDLVALTLPVPPGRERRTTGAEIERTREKVRSVRESLVRRWGATPGKMPPARVESLIEEHPDWKKALEGVPTTSLRERHKIARVALSLAAWDGLDAPTEACFLEADRFRPRAMNLGPDQRLPRA
jgi:magnesium chelatase family protein